MASRVIAREPMWRRSMRSTRQHDALVDDPEIATRIAQYEMAFQMQASVPDLMDVSKEGAKTLELYGCQPGDGSFASNCLLARRLAERGTRFIQLYHKDWDHHGGVKLGVEQKAKEIDRACMALITDLKQRGMLDETLIVWAANLAARRCPRAAAVAIITTRPCPCGWLAPASRAASCTEPPMTSAMPPWRKSPPCMICTRRCSISSASSTMPSASNSKALMRA
jgi:hypothetical protein